MVNQRWCVVQPKVREDEKAVINLLAQGFSVFRPLLREHRSRAREAKLTPMFPGYVFVGLGESGAGWLKIGHTRGVRKVMLTGGQQQPAWLPVGWVEGLQALGEVVDVFKDGKGFSKGDQVEFTQGPFAGHVGVCQWSSERRVALMLHVLGRETCVYAEPGLLKAVNVAVRLGA